MEAQTTIPDDLLKFEDLAARERKIIKKRGRKRTQIGFGKRKRLQKSTYSTKNAERELKRRLCPKTLSYT